MKSSIFLSLLILLFSCFCNELLAQEYAENRIILGIEKNELNLARMIADVNVNNIDFSVRQMRSKASFPLYIVEFEQNIQVVDFIMRIEKMDGVKFAEPDFIGYAGGMESIIPSDPHFESRQWGLRNTGIFAFGNPKNDADIDMDLAWEIEKGDENMIIAILDSGLKMDHPEVKDRLWINVDESDDGTDGDNNGYVDDFGSGWDFANTDPFAEDMHGHGTNVIGIIAAEADNDLGYAGVNWNSKIMNLQILTNQGTGFYSWWTEAIFYAVDNGAKVINMSVGGASFSESMGEAIKYAHENNVAVVACMMNTDNSVVHYPAGYDEVISVGSVDPDDERSSPFFWSNTSGSCYGEHIDLVAPGNYTYGLNNTSNSNYNSYWGGTSQASPHVAGVVSLMFAINPNLTVEEVREILHDTSEDQVGKPSEDLVGFDAFYGHGRLNAHDALSKTIGTVNIKELDLIEFWVSPNIISLGEEVKVEWRQADEMNLKLWSPDGTLIDQWDVKDNELLISGSKFKVAGSYYLSLGRNVKPLIIAN